ncbi:hypothetical protein [Bacillus rhizoplanae]|uniref:hypothetical protein n=1 Tax=Bacillus rhizoplanae TaxID=2880966 RepID=UPI003D1D095A
MKRSLLTTGLLIMMLAACSEKNVVQKETNQKESVTSKGEEIGKVVEGREYTVTAIKEDVLYLEDSNQNKKENAAEINYSEISGTTWRNNKRNGIIDVSDHVCFEKTSDGKYKAIIVKDVVGKIKYDGTIQYKIIEVTDKSIQWLPLHGENNGGYVPPEMIKITNGDKIKVGNIVTIKDVQPPESNSFDGIYELTIVE